MKGFEGKQMAFLLGPANKEQPAAGYLVMVSKELGQKIILETQSWIDISWGSLHCSGERGGFCSNGDMHDESFSCADSYGNLCFGKLYRKNIQVLHTARGWRSKRV